MSRPTGQPEQQFLAEVAEQARAQAPTGRRIRARGGRLSRTSLAWLAWALPAAAQSVPLHTGHTHRISVGANPVTGLEVGMPRGGAYARGIGLDQQTRWDESERAYRQAGDEFRLLSRRNPAWSRTVQGWIVKADFQAELSGQLSRIALRSYRMTASSYFERATARHQKWLAIRSFSGRDTQFLVVEAEEDYRTAIQRGSRYYADRARLGLAALLHQRGRHATARHLFARLRQPLPSWLSLLEAQYYAAAHQTDDALSALERAVRYSRGFRQHALRSNAFDRLRANPGFRRLTGPP